MTENDSLECGHTWDDLTLYVSVLGRNSTTAMCTYMYIYMHVLPVRDYFCFGYVWWETLVVIRSSILADRISGCMYYIYICITSLLHEGVPCDDACLFLTLASKCACTHTHACSDACSWSGRGISIVFWFTKGGGLGMGTPWAAPPN